MIDPAHMPTQAAGRVTNELARRFGGWSAVPVEFQEAAWLIYMRLREADQDIEYLWERVGRYQAPPPIAGDETGDF